MAPNAPRASKAPTAPKEPGTIMKLRVPESMKKAMKSKAIMEGHTLSEAAIEAFKFYLAITITAD